jgi:predicted Co/Zn/Cd cation transporter (cation efflux family)
LSSDLRHLTITTITTTLSITNLVTCSPCWVGAQQLQQFRRQLLIILQLLQWQVDSKISAACLLVSFSEEKKIKNNGSIFLLIHCDLIKV